MATATFSLALDAALIQDALPKHVKYDVKNGVVTLTGEVGSQHRATQAGAIVFGSKRASDRVRAAGFVNERQVKDQKATSSR